MMNRVRLIYRPWAITVIFIALSIISFLTWLRRESLADFDFFDEASAKLAIFFRNDCQFFRSLALIEHGKNPWFFWEKINMFFLIHFRQFWDTDIFQFLNLWADSFGTVVCLMKFWPPFILKSFNNLLDTKIGVWILNNVEIPTENPWDFEI